MTKPSYTDRRPKATAHELVFVVPCPPSANRLWRFVPGMRSPIKSKEYRAWWRIAVEKLKSAAQEQQHHRPWTEDLVVTVSARRPHASRDLDNISKAIFDAMGEQVDKKTKQPTGACIYRNDRQITDIRKHWARGTDGKIKRGDKVTIRVRRFQSPAELGLLR